VHGPSLFPDITLFIQLGIFLATFLVLRALVFKPYLHLLALRRDKTVGLQARAAKESERASKLQADYENFMRAERKKIAQWSEEEQRRVGDEERKIVQTARDGAAVELQGVRQKISADAEQARRELAPLVNEYSSQIVSKLLGRKITVTAAPPSGKRSEAEKAVPT
jgi:F-type H+-transporting ATPase subunit b